MVDVDPQVIEDQDRAERENYKVYKKRWLVLVTVFTITLVNGLQKSILPIESIFTNHMGMTFDNYTIMSQISMLICLVAVLPMARALEHFGFRRMAYVNCIMIIIAHSLKCVCCFDDNFVIIVPKEYRFYIILIGEIFVGLALSISSCFPPKIAYDWFPIHESTRSLVLAGIGYNVGAGASNYFAPILISKPEHMYKLGYMFIISATLMTMIVVLFIRRSRPKMPPSTSAILSAETKVPLMSGLMVMLSNTSFLLLMINFSLNTSTIGALQIILDDILRAKGYSDAFCGILISHAYIFGIIFLVIGAAWVDNSSNYITVSRLASLIYGMTFIIFCLSLNFPDIKNVISATNILTSFGNALVVPALTQVSLRSAASILPEATVYALSVCTAQIFSALLMNLEGPLKEISSQTNIYEVLLTTFSSVVFIVNILYATSFKVPSRETLQQRLGGLIPLRCSSQILNNEPEIL